MMTKANNIFIASCEVRFGDSLAVQAIWVTGILCLRPDRASLEPHAPIGTNTCFIIILR